MTLIYRIIILFIIFPVGINLWREKHISGQISAALVLIPLILRLLMIK